MLVLSAKSIGKAFWISTFGKKMQIRNKRTRNWSLRNTMSYFFSNLKRCYPSVYWSILRPFVTVRLKLPNCQLQYFIHLPAGMHPSQEIYGGIGAAAINNCYLLHTITLSSFIEITHTHTHTMKN